MSRGTRLGADPVETRGEYLYKPRTDYLGPKWFALGASVLGCS